MLYQIFKKAAANDLIAKNPVEYADKMRKRPPKRKEIFTADEVRFLMKNLPENKAGWSIRLLLATGTRIQELLALEPKHIAEDGSVIQIRQRINMVKGTPVMGHSDIKMTANIYSHLDNARKNTIAARMMQNVG